MGTPANERQIDPLVHRPGPEHRQLGINPRQGVTQPLVTAADLRVRNCKRQASDGSAVRKDHPDRRNRRAGRATAFLDHADDVVERRVLRDLRQVLRSP
jgi:hypothetical protein